MRVTFNVFGKTMAELESEAVDRLEAFIGERLPAGKTPFIEASPHLETMDGVSSWEGRVETDTDYFTGRGKPNQRAFSPSSINDGSCDE